MARQNLANQEAKLLETQMKVAALKDILDIKRGLNIQQLKEKFMRIYGDGSDPNKKYYIQEIDLMFYQLLPNIAKREPSCRLNDDYGSYQKILETTIERLKQKEALTTEIHDWMSIGDSLYERIDKSKFVTNDYRDNMLRIVKGDLDEIAKIRKLSPTEKQELEDISDFLDNPDVYDLTTNQLRSALANASLGSSDADKWKATKNYQTKIDIEDLVKKYRPTGSEASAFATHMKASDSTWTWADFSAQSPDAIIKEIKFYEKAADATKKASQIQTMKAYRAADGKPLDLTIYGDGTNITDAGIKRFLYEEAEGSDHQYSTQGSDWTRYSWPNYYWSLRKIQNVICSGRYDSANRYCLTSHLLRKSYRLMKWSDWRWGEVVEI